MRNLTAVSINSETSSMTMLAKAVLLGDGEPGATLEVAERLGMSSLVKAAVAPHLTTDDAATGGLNSSRTILTTFVPLLRNTSAFFRAFDVGLIRAPMKTRVSYLSSAAVFGRVNEGEVIKVARSEFDSVNLDPFRVAGICVFSREFLAFLSAGGEALLSRELQRAISAAADAAFFYFITDGNTPSLSSNGSTEAAALGDLWSLFNAVGLKADSRPLFVASPDVAQRAATLSGSGGRAFPDMSPMGGSMAGVPVVVTDGLDAGTLGLLDCAAIAGDVAGIEIKRAEHATIQMSDAPDSPATTSTTYLPLWQNNYTAIMPQIYLAAERLRDSAWAKITGLQWNGSGNSP